MCRRSTLRFGRGNLSRPHFVEFCSASLEKGESSRPHSLAMEGHPPPFQHRRRQLLWLGATVTALAVVGFIVYAAIIFSHGPVPGEQCDDGNTDNCDGCSSTCQWEECGNGVLECGEHCDDGNTANCDGCSSTCQLECGNGVLECAEDCDDGNTANCDGCSSTCQIEVCGNGVVECGEQCDDGLGFTILSLSCGKCSPTCTSLCGNSVIDSCDLSIGFLVTSGLMIFFLSILFFLIVTQVTARVWGKERVYPLTACLCPFFTCLTTLLLLVVWIVYVGTRLNVLRDTETCDDGNLYDGDGCSSTCKLEAICGNGRIDASSTTSILHSILQASQASQAWFYSSLVLGYLLTLVVAVVVVKSILPRDTFSCAVLRGISPFHSRSDPVIGRFHMNSSLAYQSPSLGDIETQPETSRVDIEKQIETSRAIDCNDLNDPKDAPTEGQWVKVCKTFPSDSKYARILWKDSLGEVKKIRPGEGAALVDFEGIGVQWVAKCNFEKILVLSQEEGLALRRKGTAGVFTASVDGSDAVDKCVRLKEERERDWLSVATSLVRRDGSPSRG